MVTIYHISDIHIQSGFHDDILYAINQLATLIKNDLTSTNKLIVIAGDVFEHKTKFTQYDVKCFHEMLDKLIETQIIIIPGNHDYSANATNALDLISAALINTNYKNVKLYTKSNIYLIDDYPNIEFHILSPIDNIIPNIENNDKIKIAILHEPIKGCKLYGSGTINSTRLSTDNLSKYNLALLGDIHKRQFLTPTIAYSGSLIQKTKAEDLHHGCIKWIINDNNITSESIDFKLKSAHLKVSALNDKVSLPNSELYENIKSVELCHKNCKDIKKLIPKIVKKYGNVNTINEIKTFKQETIPNSLDITQQLELMLKNSSVKDEVMDLHLSLEKEMNYNSLVKWKLDYLFWSNLYKYKENNFIDFNNLGNITALIGKNAIGKSSILHILIFVLFNKLLSGDRKSIITQGSNNYKVSCGFSTIYSDGKTIDKYILIRKGDKIIGNQHQQFCLFKNGENITDASIDESYKKVNTIIGNYQDFMDINIAFQNNIGFVDKKKESIINLFRKYLKLDMLEFNENKSNDTLKEIKAQLKLLNSKRTDDVVGDVNSLKLSIDTLTNEYELLLITVNELRLYRENILKEFIPKKEKLDDVSLRLNKLEIINEDEDELISEIELISKLFNPLVIESIKEINDKIKKITQNKKIDIVDESNLRKEIEQNNNKIQLLKSKIVNTKYCYNDIINLNFDDNLTNLNQKLSDNNSILLTLSYDTKQSSPKTKIPKETIYEIYEDGNFDKLEIDKLYSSLQPINKNFNPNVVIDKPLITNYDGILLKKIQNNNPNIFIFNDKCKNCVNNKNAFTISENNDCNENELIKQYDLYKSYVVNKKNYDFNKTIYEKINVIHDYNHYKNIDCLNKITKLKNENIELTKKIELLNAKDIIIENHKLNDEIILLTNENNKLNTNINLSKSLIELNNKLKITSSNDELTLKINKLKQKIKIKNETKTLSELLVILNNNNLIQDKLNKSSHDITNLEQKLKSIMKTINENNILLIKSQQQNEINDEITNLEHKKIIYSKYLECISIKNKNKNIPYNMLISSCKRIELNINKMLNEITTFKVGLNFDDNNFINIIENNVIIPADLGSGFQKFIIDLCLRIYLASSHPYLPNCLIIDEGFGCLDQIHLNNACNFIQKLKKSQLNWLIIISHIDELNNITNNHLVINSFNDKSNIKSCEINQELNKIIIDF